MQTQLQGVRIGASSLMTQVQGVKMGTSFSLTQLQGVKLGTSNLLTQLQEVKIGASNLQTQPKGVKHVKQQFQAYTLENFNWIIGKRRCVRFVNLISFAASLI